MNVISYADVFEIQSEMNTSEEIRAGDLVRTGANLHPHYTVIAIYGEKAWLRNVQSGQDGLTPLSRCRKVAADA